MFIKDLKPDYVFENNSGKLIQLVRNGWNQINVITSELGATRGGHYHKYNEECFYVISGSFRLTCWNKNETQERIYCSGDMFSIAPYIYHTFTYIERTIIVSMYSQGVELNDDLKDIWTE